VKKHRQVYLILALGLLAASQSGNIIRLGEAHPVAIAAWRLLLATFMIWPFAKQPLVWLKRLSKRDLGLLVLSGIALATHFFAWIAAVQNTTVANAAIFFSINPVLMAVAAFFIFRERVGIRLIVSIILGLAGVLVIGINDFEWSPHHLKGDIWAMVCALLFVIYFLCGKRLRRQLPNQVYVLFIYAVAAAVGFVCLFCMKLPLWDYSAQTWLCFLLMAMVPTMLGHTLLNYSLRYLRVNWISTATLSEPLFAGLVAYYAWGESLSLAVGIGYILICLSVMVLMLDLRRGSQSY
jgi:drug/metabolite transporter (DMT)-like permease